MRRSRGIMLFLIYPLLLLCVGAPTSAVPQQEIDALLLCKAKLENVSSSVLKGWNRGQDTCNWRGITCDLGHVTHIELVSVNLGGEVPVALRNITKLQVLNLTGCNLSGSIPPELGQLTSLSKLDLSNNNLKGSIPPQIARCHALTKLILNRNGLQGSIPGALGSMKRLDTFHVAQNQLTGSLPSELGNLISLRVINIQANKLEGKIPPEFGKLRNLQVLLGGNNKLSGTIPKELGGLKSLQFLGLKTNNLSGRIPNELYLSSIVRLILDNNKLSGPISPDLGRMTKLLVLIVNNNYLNESIPPQISNCSRLETVKLDYNHLSGSIPAELGSLRNLSIFSAIGNKLTGVIPVGLCQKPGAPLQTITLQDNQLEGFEKPGVLSNCLQLTKANFSGNQLSGPIPFPLGPMSQKLYLANNRLTGGIPANICKLLDLRVLDLSNNLLNGPLPECIGMPLLEELLLGNNRGLNATLPPSLGLCTRLRKLEVHNCSFSGPLPPQMENWTMLKQLSLANNMFTDSLPVSFANLDNLQLFDASRNNLSGSLAARLPCSESSVLNILKLQDNKFNGTIPKCLAKLSQLSYLDLSDNQLSGSIPEDLGSILKLQFLNLSHNNLDGKVPTYFSRFPATSIEGNLGLCGIPGGSKCRKKVSAGRIIIWVATAVAVFCLILFILLYRIAYAKGCKQRKKHQGLVEEEDQMEASNSLKKDAKGVVTAYQNWDFDLTFQDIKTATDNFSCKAFLGRGSSGSVYRALLPDCKTQVAVKRLVWTGTGGIQFQAEMKTLAQVRHRHLITLLGSFWDESAEEGLLIYNYMPGGSLDKALHSNEPPHPDCPMQQWPLRLKILCQVAQALKYLHSDCKPRIIHRDVKPSNVLLDEHMDAHLADFGLAKAQDGVLLGDQGGGAGGSTTALLGTVGYLAPDYIKKGHLTDKCDVYSFGVLLLETVTGRKPTDSDCAEAGIVSWVRRSDPTSVIDPKMVVKGGSSEPDEIFRVLALGLMCTLEESNRRPAMSSVVHYLEGIQRADVSRSSTASSRATDSSISREKFQFLANTDWLSSDTDSSRDSVKSMHTMWQTSSRLNPREAWATIMLGFRRSPSNRREEAHAIRRSCSDKSSRSSNLTPLGPELSPPCSPSALPQLSDQLGSVIAAREGMEEKEREMQMAGRKETSENPKSMRRSQSSPAAEADDSMDAPKRTTETVSADNEHVGTGRLWKLFMRKEMQQDQTPNPEILGS